ncbi:MAG: Rieske 2Fe-2S domain-containing protein, partial [Gammaproteobacteria bacterium]
ATQTEKGLVQYTRKALAAGVTSEEVLDALLAAFPALGLSRIVWAVEVLIEHGVPGFGEEVATAPPRIDCGPLAALTQGRAVRRGEPLRGVLLYRDGDSVEAFKAYCTHHGMELTEQGIDGATVTCFQHGWRFALPGGACTRGGQRGLEALPVSIEHGHVLVAWPPG